MTAIESCSRPVETQTESLPLHSDHNNANTHEAYNDSTIPCSNDTTSCSCCTWYQLLLTTTMRLQFQFHCHQLQPVNHYSCCIVTCRHYASRKFTKPRCCFFFRSQPAQPQQSCMNSYKHAVRGESSDLSQHSTNKETLSILYYNARS